MQISDIVITDELRAKYAERYIRDENTIRSFEYIKALPTERLEKLFVAHQGTILWVDAELQALARELRPDGSYINGNWILGRVGEELYMRDAMDEDDWCDLQDRIN